MTIEARTVDMRLAVAPAGKRVRVEGFDGGQAMRMRLAAMGIRRGTELTVVQRRTGGALIVALRDVRIAVGRSMADRLRVATVVHACTGNADA